MANKGLISPRLPAAPAKYDPVYIDTLTSILRQYFNGLDSPGPIAVATQRRSATNIVSAISCVQPFLDPLTGKVTSAVSLPTDAEFGSLVAGDIYYDTSGGVATSYPLRIKA
jgi:hypothetical protein